MFSLSSGRAGNFQELGLAADESEVAAITSSGHVPLEVVLPDGSSGEHVVDCDSRLTMMVADSSCAPLAAARPPAAAVRK